MRIAVLLALAAAAAPVPAAEFDTAAVRDDVIAWRRDIHRHPELGNRETRTAALVAKHLRTLGLEVRENVAVTGVVGVLRGGKPGPLVALRADMDALPVTEETGLPFASTATATFRGQDVGVMHACGHDGHVAILMGVAEVLAQSREALAGSVMFVFQPAEEGPPEGEKGGAERMLAEGVFAKEKPAAVFGLHLLSGWNVGTIAVRPGPAMAESDSFEIVVKGRQTHGAQPWAGVDPIVAAANIVTGLQQVVSRRIDLRTAPAVVSIGQITGGIRYNIVPDEVRLLGTIRTFDAPMREQVWADIERIAAKTAEAAGATATTRFERHTTVLVNDPELTARMRPSLEAVVGRANVVEARYQTVAEDFALFAEQVPGLYVFVGSTPKGVDPATAPSNHSPKFDLDEASLAIGVDALVRMTLDYLAAP
jgi:amidohydrolase